MMEWAIQIIGEAYGIDEAEAMLEGQKEQEGYLGGRIVPPNPIRASYMIQTFHATNGEHPRGWLPDGCRHVLLPDDENNRKALGL